MLELLSKFEPTDIDEGSECCVEFNVIALSETCVQRTFGRVCFPSKVLREKAKDLIGKPVLLDHEWKVDKIVGVVVDARFDEERKAIVARVKIPKEGNERLISLIKLSPSPIRNVSIGAMIQTKKEKGFYVVQDINFKELSLVFESADRNAKRIVASDIETLGVQNWWDNPELRKQAPKDYFLDPANRKYPYRTWDGEISCERLKRLTKETLQAMTQEELISAVETLQLKLETLEKEKEEFMYYAEIGKKYEKHLKNEVTKLVKVVEGEDSPVLKLIDRADIETLQEMEKAYREKAQEELKPSSKQVSELEEITPEKLQSMSYEELLKLKENFLKEVN